MTIPTLIVVFTMKRKRCYIMGAGESSELLKILSAEYFIAADGGYKELVSCGITPDLVIGDFDSLCDVPAHPNIIQTPTEKDETDMMMAVRKGLELGYTEFYLDGGMGGRFDHTYSNIQTLSYIVQNGARGYLLGKEVCISAIKNDKLQFKSGLSGVISVFCVNQDATGVSLKGQKYTLDNAKMSNIFPYGVSNEFTGAPAEIEVRDGVLLVIWCGSPNDVI